MRQFWAELRRKATEEAPDGVTLNRQTRYRREEASMYCNQCEQTAHGTACVDNIGVCGKDEDVQSLK